MGFRPKRDTYKLTFDDPDLEGLVVRTKSASMRQSLDAQQMMADFEESSEQAAVRAAVDLFIEFVASWNLEDDDGQTLPVTAEALLDLDAKLVVTMVYAWVDAISGVSAPLDSASTPGSQLQEVSLPMEPLSVSLPS